MKNFFITILLPLLFSSTAFAYGGARTYDIDADNVKIRRSADPSMWQGYEFGRPTGTANFFEEFYKITLAQYVVTEVGAGTQALKDEALGVLLLTNAAADNDAISMQLGNTADGALGESFLPAFGRTIYCEARWAISDATDADFMFGLSITDTTPLDSANMIAFRKDDDATAIKFLTGPNATASVDASAGTAVAATYVTTGFRVTGTSLVEYYVNDVRKGSFTTNIPTTEMRPTIHCQNGAAAAKNCSIDYVFCSQTR